MNTRRLLRDVGFAAALNTAIGWTTAPTLGAPPPPPSGPPPAVNPGDHDAYAAPRAVWQSAIGTDYVPGSSGLLLFEDDTAASWKVIPFEHDQELDELRDAPALTYVEREHYPLPSALMLPDTESGRLSVGTMIGFDGHPHHLLVLVYDPVADAALDPPGAETARLFAPLNIFTSLEVAERSAQQFSGLLHEVLAPPHAQPTRPDEPLGPRRHVEPKPGHPVPPVQAAAPVPANCAAAHAFRIKACNLSFASEVVLCTAAAVGCYAWRCSKLGATCVFLFAPVAPACWWLCLAMCAVVLAGCIAAMAIRRAACVLEAHAERILCEPGWRPPFLDYTCACQSTP